MTLQQAQKKRYALERLAQLKHNTDFDEPKCKNSLIIIALIVAVVYGIGIDYYYSTKYSQAQPGEILAKSEMSKAEIKALNVAKSPMEKRK